MEKQDIELLEKHRSRLQEVGIPAILLTPDYRILAANEAYREHYGKPISAGNDRCYRVSHGYDGPCDENGELCPLRASHTSACRVACFMCTMAPWGPNTWMWR